MFFIFLLFFWFYNVGFLAYEFEYIYFKIQSSVFKKIPKTGVQLRSENHKEDNLPEGNNPERLSKDNPKRSG